MVSAPPVERLGERTYLARKVRGHIDGRVPRAVVEHGQVAVAVGEQVGRFGKQVGAVLSPVQNRHLVAGGDGRLDHCPSDEPGSADEEDPHPSIQPGPAMSGRKVSLSADEQPAPVDPL